MYNSIFELFTINKVISPNQSGFKPGHSCINQLLFITHEIHPSFLDGLELRFEEHLFIGISKAFDLFYKFKKMVFQGNFLPYFLNFTKQRVALNGQCSSWTTIKP